MSKKRFKDGDCVVVGTKTGIVVDIRGREATVRYHDGHSDRYVEKRSMRHCGSSMRGRGSLRGLKGTAREHERMAVVEIGHAEQYMQQNNSCAGTIRAVEHAGMAVSEARWAGNTSVTHRAETVAAQARARVAKLCGKK